MKTRKLLSGAAVAFLTAAFFVGSAAPAAQAAISTNAAANIVIGQVDMANRLPNQGVSLASTTANELYVPREMATDGNKLILIDNSNNRVLIYNAIPTSNNASADVVIGQPDMTHNSVNQGSGVSASTLSGPTGVFYDGSKLFIVDAGNNRVLVYNSIPTSNNASADVVVGQQNMTSGSANQGGSAAANTMSGTNGVFSNGGKLFVSDYGNNRILIYNSIPTSNNASADIVIGQVDMTSNSANQGGSPAANTIKGSSYVISDGKKLFVADRDNHRVLIFNSIPTSNNASADVVIGQSNMTSNSSNQGGAVAANTLYNPRVVVPYGPKLLIADSDNNRVLVFNSVPIANNASADVVIGQQNMTSNSINQGGGPVAGANTLYSPRGILINDSKLIVGDFMNSRVLIYNSFGSQWTIAKGHSQTLSGDEKLKVQKKKLEFSGKKKVWKKGRVRIYRDGSLVKNVKINKGGNWKAKLGDTGSAVKEFVLKYYDSHGTLQMNSETYVLGINRGSLVETTLQKASFEGSNIEKTKKSTGGQSNWKLPEVDAGGQ
jgi:hypothetical protein